MSLSLSVPINPSPPVLHIDVVTLFPEMFEAPLRAGIVGRALERGLVRVELHNPRDTTTDRHRTVDDTPYGGGGGMVMRPEPLARCLDAVLAAATDAGRSRPRTLVMCPQGRVFSQAWARELAGVEGAAEVAETAEEAAQPRGLILVCGRYEAIDERIYELYADDLLSLGDYVLSGGEPAALVVIDALARLQPGALGCATGADHDSFSPGNGGLLDAPHYTRPEVFRGRRVPDVLLSGDHAAVARWRAEQSRQRTRQRRPDLLDK